MADVGIKVSLDGIDEAKRGLGTLEEGLAKLAARSPENARKLAEVTSAVLEVGAAHEKIASEVEDANDRIGTSSKQVTDLQEKQAAKALELQAAYEKMAASQEAAGKAIPFSPTGEALGPPPAAGPGRLLVPGASLFGSAEEQRMTAEFYARLPPRIKSVGVETKGVQDDTAALSKEVQGLLDKYNPLETRLRQLTKAQEEFRNVSMFPKGVSGESILNVEKGLQAEIDKTKEAMQNAGKGADEYGDSLASLALRYVAPIALAHQLISVMYESTTAGREAALQNIKLNAILQATGMVAGFTSSQLSEMADSMQKSTAIDSEKIKQAITVLLTFKNVQGDTFERALKLGADYARLYGGDVVSATRLIGRALDSPEHGFQMLGRTIGNLSEEQKKLIKSFTDVGDQIGAMNALLDILEGKMGGVSKAIGDSAVSAVDRFKNSWSELMKELAKGPEDPTGAGGQVYGFMSRLIDRFTKASKDMREARSVLLMERLKRESETGRDTATGFELDEQERTTRFAQSEAIRKALGIKTEKEMTDEQTQIRNAQADAFDEQSKKQWKDWAELELKKVDLLISTGQKTLADKQRLLSYMAVMEREQTERELAGIDLRIQKGEKTIADKEKLIKLLQQEKSLEELGFESKAATVNKEIAGQLKAEIDLATSLNAIVSKGNQDDLSSKLALGQITREEYEKRKTAEELRINQSNEYFTSEKLKLTEVYDREYKVLKVKQLQLGIEREQIKARGEGAVALDLKRRTDDETKLGEQLEKIQLKSAKTAQDAAVQFGQAQGEKIDQLNTEISLIGATAAQRESVMAVQKLDLDFTKQKKDIQDRNTESLERQIEAVDKLYQKERVGMTGPELQQLNIRYNEQVGSIIAKNNEEYQQQLDVITAIYEKGKTEIPELIRLLDEEKTKYEDIKEAVQGIGQAFSTAFEDAVLNGKSLRDVIKGLGEDLWRVGQRALITKPLERQMDEWLGGMVGGGKGIPGVIDESGAFGKGGIPGAIARFFGLGGSGKTSREELIKGTGGVAGTNLSLDMFEPAASAVGKTAASATGVAAAATTNTALTALSASTTTADVAMTAISTSVAATDAGLTTLASSVAAEDVSVTALTSAITTADAELATLASAAASAAAALSTISATSGAAGGVGLFGSSPGMIPNIGPSIGPDILAAQGAAGGGFMELADLFHSGGVVGDSKTQRFVHPAVFADAPRFHKGGLLPGEVPLIGKRGERMLTEEQNKKWEDTQKHTDKLMEKIEKLSAALSGANLKGFQSGGDFMVGGSGGIDSQFVGFKATPGEKVTVETPGQQNRPGSRGGRSIVINGPLISVSTPDAGSFNRYSGQLGADLFATLSTMNSRFR
jgi:hypothetical protein